MGFRGTVSGLSGFTIVHRMFNTSLLLRLPLLLLHQHLHRWLSRLCSALYLLHSVAGSAAATHQWHCWNYATGIPLTIRALHSVIPVPQPISSK